MLSDLFEIVLSIIMGIVLSFIVINYTDYTEKLDKFFENIFNYDGVENVKETTDVNQENGLSQWDDVFALKIQKCWLKHQENKIKYRSQ